MIEEKKKHSVNAFEFQFIHYLINIRYTIPDTRNT